MDNIFLYKKLALLPDNLKSEVGDFIDFLAMKVSRELKERKPKFGSAKGMFIMKPNFDEPLEDFNEYMH